MLIGFTIVSCNRGTNPPRPPSSKVPPGNNLIYAIVTPNAGSGNVTYGIYTNNADTGGTQTPLIESQTITFHYPNWTNEDKVYFLSNLQGEASRQIYSINFDSTNIQRISKDLSTNYYTLDFSPVNGRFLYHKNTGGSKQLCTNNLQMDDEKVLLSQEVSASWHPDGRTIVYSNWELNSNGEKIMNLFRMNADGTGITRITSNTLPQLTYQTPFISPNGSKIIYTSYRDRLVTNTTLTSSLSDAYICDIDGSNEKRVTNSLPQTEFYYNGNWANDSKKALVIYKNIRLPYTLSVRSTENNSGAYAAYSWDIMDSDIK